MKPNIKFLTLLLSILAAFAGVACANLSQHVEAIVASQTQGKVRFAVQIIDPASGSVIYSRNASAPMIPASNMKVITTAAALKYLGPDFTYQTVVGLSGDSLVIIGSGDPLLGDKPTAEKHSVSPRWVLNDIAEQLRKNNVAAVSDIIVDSSVFDDEHVHPHWPKKELNKWYACEVSGLNYNDNCIDITAETAGPKVQLTIDPPTAYVQIINKCTPTNKPPDTVWGARPAGSNVITVSGACYKTCQPIYVTIDRPPVFFGFLVSEEIARAGISVRGRLVERALLPSESFKPLAVYRTSLWDVFDRCNKNSLGLAAESLLKTVAAHRQPSGKGGSWVGGQTLNSYYLLSLGIPADQFLIDDGSGLSEKNRLSANALSTVLLDLYKKPTWQNYKQTLAVGGIDGTAGKWFNEPKYKGKVFGKTGYIDGVKSFSGVCSTNSGDRIFSIITNNPNGSTREAINDIVKAIIDESR